MTITAQTTYYRPASYTGQGWYRVSISCPGLAGRLEVLAESAEEAEAKVLAVVNTDPIEDEKEEDTRTLMIDPPSGWRYGFPKPYNKSDDMPLADWLIVHDYPESEAEFASKHCRWWCQ